MKALAVLLSLVLFAQTPPLTKAEELQAAARKGDAAAVKKLLDEGVDVNTKFRYDATALFYAADHGHLEVVKVLLDHGADVSVKDKFYGFTPLLLALSPAQAKKPEHTEIAKLLIAKGAPGKDAALTQTLQGGDLPLAKFILESGGIAADTLSEALAIAKMQNKPEAIALLEQNGAKPYEEFKVDAAQLARYAGSYKNAAGNEVVISVVDGRLVGQPVGGPRAALVAREATVFRLIGQAGSTLTFNSEGDKVSGFTLAGPGRPSVVYTRVEGK